MPMSAKTAHLYVGLMSGTSLDGVDAALVDFSGPQPALRGTHYLPYPEPLVKILLQLHHPRQGELHEAQLVSQQLARLYAQTVNELLHKTDHGTADIAAIGNHGQTVRHCPESSYTIQLSNNALLAELTGIDVIGDFRARDLAAGGQGAPLVPAFHAAVFGSPQHNRLILNIGGIANISYLPRDGDIFGFDTGPGNLLLDSWIRQQQNQPFDSDGRWAASGTVVPKLLASMLREPYFQLRPPKSTGRDLFHLDWLTRHLTPEMTAADVQATLLALTATSIGDAVQHFCKGCEEIFVCGGGARNAALMQALKTQLAGCHVATTEALGIHPDWVEAAAFAWLARQFDAHQPGNLPQVTGARGSRILGARYPA